MLHTLILTWLFERHPAKYNVGNRETKDVQITIRYFCLSYLLTAFPSYNSELHCNLLFFFFSSLRIKESVM